MTKYTNSALKIAGAIVTIAIGAQISIDMGEIPITGQTLAILAWAFFLEAKESFIAIGIYLLIGIFGIPVFADGSYGLSKLFGGSGGYLIGFLVAAIFVSFMQGKYNITSMTSILGLTSIGTIIILFFGIGRLIMIYGIEKGFEYGFHPFWKGAIVKIIIGSLLVWIIKRMLKAQNQPI